MEMSRLNYFIDLILGVSFTFVVLSILGLEFNFLADRGVWMQVHEISGAILIFLGILHFVLHLKWFKIMTQNLLSKK